METAGELHKALRQLEGLDSGDTPLLVALHQAVESAAASLEKADRLIRRPDGTWLVREHSATVRTAPESVAQRRRLLAT